MGHKSFGKKKSSSSTGGAHLGFIERPRCIKSRATVDFRRWAETRLSKALKFTGKFQSRVLGQKTCSRKNLRKPANTSEIVCGQKKSHMKSRGKQTLRKRGNSQMYCKYPHFLAACIITRRKNSTGAGKASKQWRLWTRNVANTSKNVHGVCHTQPRNHKIDSSNTQ